jgi:bleomycin hydrolase
MVANLIRKYGAAPKSAMADTFNLTDSKFLNKVVDAKLRQAAAKIFGNPKRADAIKQEALSDVYRILCILMGEPPQRFDFTYRDKKKKFHAHRDLTPHAFYEQFVGLDLDDYAWVMSAPLPSTPYGRTYYVDQLQNVVEGKPGLFLNVEMPALKDLAVRALKDKQALFFGCDVLQASHRKLGILDPGVLEYDLLFNTTFEMTRAERMQFLQARLTHDMVILGVDLHGDKPLKWKIENSWGDEPGHKGIFQMSDAWFDEHVYALVVHKKYLSAAQKKQLQQPPTVLPPWHPLA